MRPTIDPANDFIRLSKRGEHGLAALGVEGGTVVRRRAIVDAASTMQPLNEPSEMHFLARAVINGRNVVCLCLKYNGSLRTGKKSTVIIRAVFEPEEAEQLLEANKGLAPFAERIITGATSAKYHYQGN